MSELTIDEILNIDRERNYPNKDISLEMSQKALENRIINGETMYRHGNSLFFVEEKGDGIEWHTVNADSGLDLIKNTNNFLEEIKEFGYKFAITYFDNPKILKLADACLFPQSTSKVDEGEYKTYKMVVRL